MKLFAIAATLIFAMSSAQALAKPSWVEVTTERAAADAVASAWFVRTGSVGRDSEGNPTTVYGTVMHRTAENPEGHVYLVRVNAQHCGAERGDVAILTLDGSPVASIVFSKKGSRVGDRLAARICYLARNIP